MCTLLKDFGDLLGLELSFDENGQCLFEVDEQFLISIRKKGENYSFYGMLGEFPDVEDDNFWKNVVATNMHLVESDDGVICLETSTDCLVLIKNIRLFQLDALGLMTEVGNFVKILEHLIEQLSGTDVNSDTDDEVLADSDENQEQRNFDLGLHSSKV